MTLTQLGKVHFQDILSNIETDNHKVKTKCLPRNTKKQTRVQLIKKIPSSANPARLKNYVIHSSNILVIPVNQYFKLPS
jgi:hypothetical protein